MSQEQHSSNIFNQQHRLIDYFFEHLDYSEIDRFINHILNCHGLIFLSGMGKSGIIAKNICQMLVSTGIRAMFLDPVNALHGDVGVITANDLVILFSRSGQTSELINLIPAVRNKKAFIISVLSNRICSLAKMSDEIIFLPLEKELCPFDLAPTTSSIIQLIFGNTVVACLMHRTGLTKEQYAMNHPAGRIGKRLIVRVEDVMRPLHETATCSTNDLLINQIDNMSKKCCGNLLIIDADNHLLGIFTDGDLRRAIHSLGTNALTMPLGQLMHTSPTTTIRTTMAYDAMKIMESDTTDGKKRVKELPVVNDDGILEGLLTLHDLVKYGL